jgi:hypothetical protein
VSWTFIAAAAEVRQFRRCRRAWDLGAEARQGYSPRPPPFDFDRAARQALATYYFPAMDDWSRAIVRPLAIKAFERAMAEGRAAHEAVGPRADDEQDAFLEHLALGRAMLANYFAWAAGLDDFDSIFVDHDVWAPIPDPDHPGRDLGTSDGGPIRLLGRIDQVIGDPSDEFWVVHHRLVSDTFADDATLIDDEISRVHCWGLQIEYPQLVVAGSVINELRLDGQLAARPPVDWVERDTRDMTGARHVNRLRSPTAPPLAWVEASMHERDDIAARDGNDLFRRTVIRRSQATLAEAGARVAADVERMLDPALDLAPSFGPQCGTCPFKGPCDAMEAGADPADLLAARYVRGPSISRAPDPTGLGGRGARTVNFRWG